MDLNCCKWPPCVCIKGLKVHKTKEIFCTNCPITGFWALKWPIKRVNFAPKFSPGISPDLYGQLTIAGWLDASIID